MAEEQKKSPYIPDSVFVAPGAVIRGDVTVGENSSIWYHSTVRADYASARIGRDTNIQDNCVVHVDMGRVLEIGDGVTVGHSAIVHGCKVGNNTLIGMGAIVMNDAVVGDNCIIGAGALVTERMIIPDNSLVLGQPGRIKRSVTPEEIEANRSNARHYVKEAESYRESDGNVV